MKVTVFDREGPAAGASFGNGGVLVPCAVVPVMTPGIMLHEPAMLFDRDGPLFMKWSYLPKLAPFLFQYLKSSRSAKVEHIASHLAPLLAASVEEHQELARGTIAEKWIRPSTYLYIYEDKKAFEKDAYGWGLRARNNIEWTCYQGGEVKELEPDISDAYQYAVELAGHGFIANPGQYVKDLAASFVADGGELIIAEVTGIDNNSEHFSIKTADKQFTADKLVIATGAWSGDLARQNGVGVPLEAERGYHLQLANPSKKPIRPIMNAAKKFVAVPMDDGLRLAGIVEFGGLEAAASKGPVELLMRGARHMLPGLEFSSTTEWLGFRPATTDSLPVLGEAPAMPGLYFNYGHQHVGMTAGPKSGRVLAQLINGDKPNLDLSAYRPDR